MQVERRVWWWGLGGHSPTNVVLAVAGIIATLSWTVINVPRGKPHDLCVSGSGLWDRKSKTRTPTNELESN